MATSLRRSLEDHPDSFFERYAAHAIEAELLPQPTGSPLAEVLTPLGVLLAFDRGLPPAHFGPQKVLLHGVVEAVEYGPVQVGFERKAGGRYELRALVQRGLGQGMYLVDAGVPIVVSGALEVGQEATLTLSPPLMAFRAESSS